jgi:hypothetical protein
VIARLGNALRALDKFLCFLGIFFDIHVFMVPIPADEFRAIPEKATTRWLRYGVTFAPHKRASLQNYEE